LTVSHGPRGGRFAVTRWGNTANENQPRADRARFPGCLHGPGQHSRCRTGLTLRHLPGWTAPRGNLTVQRYLDLTVDRLLRFRLRRRGFLRLRTTGCFLCLDAHAARLRAWW